IRWKPLDHPSYGAVRVAVLEDLTEWREAESRLRASLEEKEVLVREIHHRVKNNLQVISSLLSIQARTLTEPKLRSTLKESLGRLRAIALIHEKLYRAENLARVGMRDYLQSLIHNLMRALRNPGQAIAVELDVDTVELGVDTAIPVGLIVNELMSN